MTTAYAQQVAMTETYSDVHKLICHTVHAFVRANGDRYGTFDELLAQANLEFVKSCSSFEVGRGTKYSSWCRWVVHKSLLEHQRTVSRRHKQCQITVMDMSEDDTIGSSDSTFDLVAFKDELTSDAQYVTELALNPPRSLCTVLRETSGRSARSTRNGIRQYLYGMGWSKSRVDTAFEDITTTLHD